MLKYIVWILVSAAVFGATIPRTPKYLWASVPSGVSMCLGLVCWMCFVAQTMVG